MESATSSISTVGVIFSPQPLVPASNSSPEKEVPPFVIRQPLPLPGHCSKKHGNSNTSMVGAKCNLYWNSRTRPYYIRRCKRVRRTNIESLPNHLLSDILVHLPADYLHDRARLVCRSWYHIIHSYNFVKAQIQHSTYGLVISNLQIWRSSRSIFVTETQGRIEVRKFDQGHIPRYRASCNGVVLDVNYDTGSLYILNPATKQELFLPPFPGPARRERCGIAYAAASMEYKVAVPYLFDKEKSSSLFILTVGVDNSWREIHVEHLPKYHQILLWKLSMTTEGFIHWVDGDMDGHSILTLDVETEVITLSGLPLPEAYHDYRIRKVYLSTGRFLTLLVNHKELSWEVWGKKSQNGEWSKLLPDIDLWNHKYWLQQFACGEDDFPKPFGWIRYPEVLAFRFNSKRSSTCICYNLNTHEINSIELSDFSYYFCGRPHKNNLIRLIR